GNLVADPGVGVGEIPWDSPRNQVRTGLPAGAKGIRTAGPPLKNDDVFRDHADNLRPLLLPENHANLARGTGGSNPLCSSDESARGMVRGSCLPTSERTHGASRSAGSR